MWFPLQFCLITGVQYLSSSLKAVRALVILGEIGLFWAFIIGVAMYCWKRNQHLKFRADAILTIFSGLLFLIYETEFVLFLAVLENSFLHTG